MACDYCQGNGICPTVDAVQMLGVIARSLTRDFLVEEGTLPKADTYVICGRCDAGKRVVAALTKIGKGEI